MDRRKMIGIGTVAALGLASGVSQVKAETQVGFKTGDRVVLKSGGRIMLVTHTAISEFHCLEEEDVKEIPNSILKKYYKKRAYNSKKHYYYPANISDEIIPFQHYVYYTWIDDTGVSHADGSASNLLMLVPENVKGKEYYP